MKKTTLILLALVAVMNLHAQTGTTLKLTLQLKMPRTEEDDKPGTRGACVTWHPVQKKYYAAMAGNFEYPMGVFDATGKLVSAAELNTGQDIRGLWYNATKKQLQGNAYSDIGWFSYTLNAKGIPTDNSVFLEGMNQPDDQSVGAFNNTKQQVFFLKEEKVYTYDMEGIAVSEGLDIHFGRTKKDGLAGEDDFQDYELAEDYNYTTVIYTGIKGQELGLLNTYDRKIELYNVADGFLTKTLLLPEDAPVNTSFNFAYANGIYWLFDMDSRTWKGYK